MKKPGSLFYNKAQLFSQLVNNKPLNPNVILPNYGSCTSSNGLTGICTLSAVCSLHSGTAGGSCTNGGTCCISKSLNKSLSMKLKIKFLLTRQLFCRFKSDARSESHSTELRQMYIYWWSGRHLYFKQCLLSLQRNSEWLLCQRRNMLR